MADFLVPALGADMESGKVVQWLVTPGSRVKSGDVVVVLETHKGAFDCEVFQDGVIEDLAPLGTELPVGAVLAHVRGDESRAETTEGLATEPRERPGRVPAARPAGARVKASPAARRRARELGLVIEGISSDAPGAPIELRHVEAAAASRLTRPAPAGPSAANAPLMTRPAAARGFDPAAMRQGIAMAMARSKREIPHYYLERTVDFDAAERWIASYNANRAPDERLLAAVLLLKATAMALARYPQFNGFWEQGAFRAGQGFHVGWAVAMRGGGLVAPAIHDVDRKSLPELMTELRDLVQRVRSGGIRGSEMTDPTVTVTSMGERGPDRVFGVIYPPQVALIGFGAVRARPWVMGGDVRARSLVEVSLSADHRASDGHAGGLLLAAIDEALQTPEQL